LFYVAGELRNQLTNINNGKKTIISTSSRSRRGIYVITLRQAQGENNLMLNVHEIAALVGQDVSSKRPIPKDTSSRARRGINVITLRQAHGENK